MMAVMKEPRMWRDMIAVSLAMFAVVFGAGNLSFRRMWAFRPVPACCRG